MIIVYALKRVSESSKELEALCKNKADGRKTRIACRTLYQELWAVVTEVEAARARHNNPRLQGYEMAMQFLREALAIRYDQAHYRSGECLENSIVHACWLELGQLCASGRLDCNSSTMVENGHSFGKAVGPAAKKALTFVCDHVFEKSPPRTPARLLIEDGRAVKDDEPPAPQGRNIYSLTMYRAAKRP